MHILLATYNGEPFLAEQLESLERQTHAAWTLLVMDDGSTDDTAQIIAAAAQQDHRIRFERRKRPGRRSAVKSFGELLELSYELGAEYVFCCDQDDVWHPDKIDLILSQLRRLEGSSRTPVLIHHDLEVVDQELHPVSRSFWSMVALKPGTQKNPQRLLSRNEVTGCAMACNRALLEKALPIPTSAIMHDWWLALCAAYFGQLAPLPQPLVKYRQHGRNAIGAKSFWRALNPFTNWWAGWRRGNEEFLETVAQAQVFRDRFADQLEPEAPATVALELYRRLPTLARRDRMAALRLANIWRHQWLLDTVLAVRILTLPRSRV